MKKHVFRLSACLTGIILIFNTIITYAAPDTVPEPAFYCSHEIILLLKQEADEHIISLLNNSPFNLGILEYQDDFMLVSVDDDNLTECVTYLNSLDFVLTAELNQEITISQAGSPAPYIYNAQQYVYNLQPHDISINTTLRKEVIVAVMDTGIDYMHPELLPYMWVNKGETDGNGIDDDGNGYIDDIYGWDFYNGDSSVCHYTYDGSNNLTADPEDNDNHGTHCAGIIAEASRASLNNIKLMSLKIHGGKDGKGSIANGIKAIKYASLMGADICNMSWGTNIYSEALEQVMRESDMLFITAAGNDGRNIEDYPMYPACFDIDNMIVTSFTDAEGQITYESNYSTKYVDIGAPGVDISSTIVGSFGIMKGSSMAAPYVSGAAAILYAEGENIFAADVKKVLISSLYKTYYNKGYVAYPGIINLESLKEYRTALKKDTIYPKLNITTTYKNETLLLKLNASDTGGSSVRVIKYASGTKVIKDFKKGMAGTSAKTDMLALSKSGHYTFYISDYAGNEAVYYYTVVDDTVPPKITASYSITSRKNFYAISVQPSDDKSGVKLVKYMEGKKGIQDFRSSVQGTIIESNDGINYTFTVESSGKYTIYALDYRGNASVHVIDLPEAVVESFYVKDYGKMLTVGSQYLLTYTMLPSGAEDTVTYKSSKPSVASVNHNGIITALSPGLTTITASTSQGLTSQCLIFVTYNNIIKQSGAGRWYSVF